MFDVGGGELILIILAVIVLFGPNKIPEIAKTISKGYKQFRDVQSELSKQISTVKEEIDSQASDIKKSVESANIEKNIPSSEDISTDNDIKKTEFSSPENSVISTNFKPITTELKDDDNSLV